MSKTTSALLRTVFLVTAGALAESEIVPGTEPLPAVKTSTETVPWWRQQKIRFYWGQWNQSTEADEPMELVMANLARVGATVFADQANVKPAWARLARQHGIRYFGSTKLSALCRQRVPDDARVAVNRDGGPHLPRKGSEIAGFRFLCPLYRPLYEAWFLKPALELARSRLGDGFHSDWEPYGGKGEAGICYCDDCFRVFRETYELDVSTEIPKAQRFAWLEARGLNAAYVENYEDRRAGMFRDFAQAVREVNPDFVFSGYNVFDDAVGRGLHSDRVPFFIVDQRHYYEDYTRPWWESHDTYYRKLGYVRIPGCFDNTSFGGQPQFGVSAAQVIYEHAINTDGTWMWFEQEISPDLWRTFWIADRRIRATEQKVGPFLCQGQRDIHFVTPVEWSGRPEFERRIIQCTYHLNGEHLAHIQNVDVDRPVQIRLRFPYLPGGSRWIVTDPITDTTWRHSGDDVSWTAARLTAGLVVSMEQRSEIFVKLSPAAAAPATTPANTLVSGDTRSMPDHPATAGPAPSGSASPGPERLLYTKAESMGYNGREGGWALGNVICTINADNSDAATLYKVKGYLWSPVWAPDGRRIAFCHDSNGRGQIHVMSADGSGAFNLSNNDYCDRAPVWSPGGSRIAFLSDRGGVWQIYVTGADGKAVARLTAGPGSERAPAWSPDGRHIAFESDREGDVDLYMIEVGGTDAQRLTNGPGDEQEPAWSPDGTRLAFVGTGGHWFRDLQTLDVESREASRIHEMPHLGAPSWCPDGLRIACAFRGPQEIEKAGVFVTNPDEPEMRKLVDEGAMKPYSSKARLRPAPSWYAMGSASPRWVVRRFGSVSWSADGTHIAFSADITGDGYFYVYIMPVDGAEPTRLSAARSPWPQEVMWCPR